VRQAGTHVETGDRRDQVLFLHQNSKVLLECGEVDEADQALERALASYRELNDTYGEVRALALRVQILERRGLIDEAFACAREILSLASRHEYALMSITGRLELGRLHLQTGSVGESLELLREALGQAVLLGDKNAEFLAHYYLWKGYESIGDRDRSRVEREAASYFVRFVDDHSSEADEIRRGSGGQDNA
jgi:tetratricopeptide (TPR) repeat protein